MKRVCVFCGSNAGSDPRYLEAAQELGRLLARRDLGLVYGGSSVGLMGALADATLAAGGHVTGIIPAALRDLELAHNGLPDLRVVGSMHERKALMESLSDGFIALPGGFGTLDELCEAFTWLMLGIHQKPVGLLNVAGYYDDFLAFIDRATRDRFVRAEHRAMFHSGTDVVGLLEQLFAFRPTPVRKWL